MNPQSMNQLRIEQEEIITKQLELMDEIMKLSTDKPKTAILMQKLIDSTFEYASNSEDLMNLYAVVEHNKESFIKRLFKK